MAFTVAIDPELFAIAGNLNAEALETFVEGLLAWSSVLGDIPANALLSNRAIEALAADGSYPHYSHLRNCIAQAGFSEVYSATTLSSVIERLIRRLEALETAYLIEDITWDVFSWALTDGQTSEVADVLRRTGAIIAIGSDGNEFVCVGGVYPPDRNRREQVSIHNLLVQPVDENLTEHALVETLVDTVNSTEFMMRLDPVMFLRDGDARIAIALELHRRRQGQEQNFEFADLIHSFSVGPNFVPSIVAHGFGDDPAQFERIISACADAVLSENLRKVHGLRAGKGPEETQISRGRDLAWRRDIDYEYHLHYWQEPGGKPHFADVVVHEEFRITG